MLPENYCEDDKDWVKSQIARCRTEKHRALCKRYSEVYMEAFSSEPISYRKEGAARKAANIRLLRFVKKESAIIWGRP